MSRSERWNTINEIKRRFHETTDPVNGAGPVVYVENGRKYSDDSESHIAVIGRTGKGKSQCCSLPFMREILKKGESLIMLDPKGEGYKKNACYICLILAMQSYQWSRTMFSVANVNVILAGVNLLPASGLDGESALSAACGINSISEVARKWLTNKKCRKKLLRAGLPGYACFCFFSVTMISKVILWLLIGLDVVLVFFNIF